MYVKQGKNKGTYYLTITRGTDVTGRKIRYNRTVHASGKRELEREKNRFIRDVENGVCSTRKRGKYTLLELCQYVYGTYFFVSSKETTLKGYRNIIKRISNFPISSAKANKIKPMDIQKFIRDMQSKNGSKDGYSPKTIKSTISFVSACYEQILGQIDGIYDNPCKHIKLPKNEKSNKRTLSSKELPIFIQNLSTLDCDTAVMFELALFLGLRRSETLGLTFSDVKDGYIDVNKTRHSLDGEILIQTTKTHNSTALIALPDFLAEDIKKLKEYHEAEKIRLGSLYDGTSDFLILSPEGKPIHEGRANGRLHKYAKDIGIAPISYHELRHTYASMINNFGADITELASLMRHADATTSLSIYTHMLESVSDSSKKFANKIENFYNKNITNGEKTGD